MTKGVKKDGFFYRSAFLEILNIVFSPYFSLHISHCTVSVKPLSHRFRQLKSLLQGLSRVPFASSQFGIKRGYIHRKINHHFSAIEAKDECQREVYEAAAQLAEKYQYTTIVDVGCGGAYKLAIPVNSPDSGKQNRILWC